MIRFGRKVTKNLLNEKILRLYFFLANLGKQHFVLMKC